MAGSGDLVSILVPVFNGEQFIGRTLGSLLEQTHRNIEIVVVDDGSSDGTAAILDTMAKSDARIRVFRADRRGPACARNHAARQARGDFIAPCDSDDLWHPEKIERQLAAILASSPRVGVVYCWSVGINERDEVVFPNWAHKEAEGNVLEATIVDSLSGSGSVILVRRSHFDAVGGFSEDIFHGDEWQICMKLAEICEFALVKADLVGYRIRSGSTSSDYVAVESSLARSTRWIADRWPNLPQAIMRKRSYTVNSYLAFLAARRRNFRMAAKYKLRAFAAHPSRIIGRSMFDFCLLLWGQLFGVHRYYTRFWRVPRRWEGAGAKSVSGDGT